MLNINDALELVQPHLRAVAAHEGAPITVTSVERVSGGWLIRYNTEEFALTGDPLSGLLGNLPLEVRDDGGSQNSA